MIEKFIILISYLITIPIFGQQSGNNSKYFNRDKWLSDSYYRYYIVKTDTFPDLAGKSRRYVKKRLGKPDFIANKNFIYCFDLKDKINSCNKCKGSQIIIDFKIDKKFSVTFMWVE